MGLKKTILSDVSVIALQPIKDIVNKQQEKYIKKIRDTEGQEPKKQDKQTKNPIFQGYFGKYLADKDIARVVQKSFIKK